MRGTRIATSRLTPVEVASSAAGTVRRGEMTAAQFRRTVRAVQADVREIEIVELGEIVETAAVRLVAEHGLRAGDAIRLASCLVLRDEFGGRVEFACFDGALAAAARAEGLPVLGVR